MHSTMNVNIEPFLCKSMGNEVGEKWQRWLRNFNLMIEMKKISEAEMKKTMLLYMAGTQVQEIFDTLPAEEPKDNEDKFTVAVRVLSNHFVKKRNVTFERHIFRGLQQGPTEKIEQFVLRLRQQAQKCNFDKQADDNIKDQLIEKCLSAELKTKILDKGDDLSLTEAVQLAATFESVLEQLSAMKSAGNSLNTEMGTAQTVNRVQIGSNKPKWRQDTCRRCGRRGHDGGDKCPAKAKPCHKCQKVGHFASKCFSKVDGSSKTQDEPAEKKRKEEKSARVQNVTTIGTAYTFCVATDGNCAENEIWCTIGGVKIKALIDSGSKYNLIDIDSWQWLKEQQVVVTNMQHGSDRVFKAYGGHELDIRGTLEAIVMAGPETTNALFYVTNEKGKILIGSDTAKMLKVLAIGISTGINEVSNEKIRPLSKIRDVLIEIPIDRNVRPIQQRYRRVPVPLEEATNKKIQEMVDRDIIEKVDGPSAWISPMVVVPKPNNEIRICIDMREANKAIMRINHP